MFRNLINKKDGTFAVTTKMDVEAKHYTTIVCDPAGMDIDTIVTESIDFDDAKAQHLKACDAVVGMED